MGNVTEQEGGKLLFKQQNRAKREGTLERFLSKVRKFVKMYSKKQGDMLVIRGGVRKNPTGRRGSSS